MKTIIIKIGKGFSQEIEKIMKIGGYSNKKDFIEAAIKDKLNKVLHPDKII